MYSIYSNDNLLKLSLTSIFSSLSYNEKKRGFKKRIFFTDQYYERLEDVVSESLEDKNGIIVIFTHQSHTPINIGSRIILISLNTSLTAIYQFLSNLVKKTLLLLQEVTLSKTEMLFLFLYYKNWSVEMMSSFLEIHEKTVTNTKHFLKKKYGIKDDIMFVTLSKSYSFYLNSFG
ncbi:hypothetical protein [Pantoea sp. B65]|uniref:hypothetical protein n=1 Tax=Pantoea sp. B65 TaxID=2813359 RepID=UPI0039B4B36B